MSTRLATYLNDHLAGAQFAIRLLEHLRESNAGEPIGNFAAKLLVDIEDDRTVLQGIAQRFGGQPNPLKEAAAWLAEKASRLKLRLGSDAEIGRFEALEALSLGVLGKLALWRALEAVANTNTQLRGIDFDRLSARAESQHSEIEAYRLTAAQNALRGD
jgi:hypothetical protein